MNTWKLAQIKVSASERTAIERLRVHQALQASRSARTTRETDLRARIRLVKDFVLRIGESLYCRTLGLLYVKTD